MYNRFHKSSEAATNISRMRELQVEMDYAIVTAYNWADLDLDHGFHETRQGIRFTFSEVARREVLDRLLALNHQRYAEEVERGLHDKKSSKDKSGAKGSKQSSSGQGLLAGFAQGEK